MKKIYMLIICLLILPSVVLADNYSKVTINAVFSSDISTDNIASLRIYLEGDNFSKTQYTLKKDNNYSLVLTNSVPLGKIVFDYGLPVSDENKVDSYGQLNIKPSISNDGTTANIHLKVTYDDIMNSSIGDVSANSINDRKNGIISSSSGSSSSSTTTSISNTTSTTSTTSVTTTTDEEIKIGTTTTSTTKVIYDKSNNSSSNSNSNNSFISGIDSKLFMIIIIICVIVGVIGFIVVKIIKAGKMM